MPYRVCPYCALMTYSAARHSTSDACPRCRAPLSAAPALSSTRARTPGLRVDYAALGAEVSRDGVFELQSRVRGASP